MKPIIYKDFQGAGYVAENLITTFYTEKETNLAGERIVPGMMTTLAGYFTRPLKYLGIHDSNEMIFLVKTESDLFGNKYFFLSVFRISETRIFEMFGDQFGSDHNFVNGDWK